jgi:hypothetical protein
MINFLLKNKIHFLVLFISTISYFSISFILDLEASKLLMFDGFQKGVDSVSYLQVGEWIYTQKPTYALNIRPYFYPLIVKTLSAIGGFYLIWFFHFACYIFSNLFIFKAVHLCSKSIFLAAASSIIFLSNLSLVAISYHALNETITVFILSIFIYLTALKIAKIIVTEQFWNFTVLIFGVLTVIKPVFSIPFTVLICLHVVYLLLYKKNVKTYLVPFIAVFIVSIQLMIMKVNFNVYSISKISEITYKKYLFSQFISNKYSIDRKNADKKIDQLSNKEIQQISKDNFQTLFSNFRDNLKNNIISPSYFETNRTAKNYPRSSLFMINYNFYSYKSHILVFISCVLILFFQFYRKLFKKEENEFWILFTIFSICTYYIVVTGISFYQLDRLVLGCIPLWLFLINFVIVTILKKGKVN